MKYMKFLYRKKKLKTSKNQKNRDEFLLIGPAGAFKQKPTVMSLLHFLESNLTDN